jgi:hypothetical protein
MLHGRHDRNRNTVAAGATATILCDQDEFGKTIGKAPRQLVIAGQSSDSTLSKNE